MMSREQVRAELARIKNTKKTLRVIERASGNQVAAYVGMRQADVILKAHAEGYSGTGYEWICDWLK
jgi:hypothetical protein